MARQKTPYLKYKPKELKDLTWRIIIEAWENGASNREVSLRLAKSGKADELSPNEIAKLYQQNPAIADLKSMLDTDLINSARTTVAEAIKEGDIKTAKWYLERKQADEFSTKQAVAFEGAVIELSIEDKEKALKEMVEKFEADGE